MNYPDTQVQEISLAQEMLHFKSFSTQNFCYFQRNIVFLA